MAATSWVTAADTAALFAVAPEAAAAIAYVAAAACAAVDYA